MTRDHRNARFKFPSATLTAPEFEAVRGQAASNVYTC
jgi:hypothetical protein